MAELSAESHEVGSPAAIDGVLAYLTGEWAVERRISDRWTGAFHTFTGQATIAPAGDGLDHVEVGELAVGACAMESTMVRRYAGGSNGTAVVTFADGRHFHDLDLRSGTWQGTHLCGNDRYDGTIAAVDADTMTVVWVITGPSKDMTITSSYRRLAGTDHALS